MTAPIIGALVGMIVTLGGLCVSLGLEVGARRALERRVDDFEKRYGDFAKEQREGLAAVRAEQRSAEKWEELKAFLLGRTP